MLTFENLSPRECWGQFYTRSLVPGRPHGADIDPGLQFLKREGSSSLNPRPNLNRNVGEVGKRDDEKPTQVSRNQDRNNT